MPRSEESRASWFIGSTIPPKSSTLGLVFTAHTAPAGDATYQAALRLNPIFPLAFTAPAVVRPKAAVALGLTGTHGLVACLASAGVAAIGKASITVPTAS